jgi:2-dehydro-3-deoxygluconokinase
VTAVRSADVLVIGEVLVELSAADPLETAVDLRLGFSGDALNAAAAAAASGAHVALLTRVADDELGHRLLERIRGLGIDTAAIQLVPGQHGLYFVGADPDGQREFLYARRGSAACALSPADLDRLDPARAAVTLCSGITCAISPSAADTVHAAAQRASGAGRSFVYDPNYRPRLTGPEQAGRWLRRLAPLARLVLPSCPGETGTLLGTTDPFSAAAAVRDLGAAGAAVTCGARGIAVDDGGEQTWLDPVPASVVVDQTGAGDAFAGTVAARLALGDDLVTAARTASAAASLSLQGQGGTGFVPSLAQTLAHLATISTSPSATPSRRP